MTKNKARDIVIIVLIVLLVVFIGRITIFGGENDTIKYLEDWTCVKAQGECREVNNETQCYICDEIIQNVNGSFTCFAGPYTVSAYCVEWIWTKKLLK